MALGRLEPPRAVNGAVQLWSALRRELLRCLWCAGSFDGDWEVLFFLGFHLSFGIFLVLYLGFFGYIIFSLNMSKLPVRLYLFLKTCF